MNSKSDLRKILLKRRLDWDKDEKLEAENKLRHHLLTSFQWEEIDCVYGYWGMQKTAETNTIACFESLIDKFPHLQIAMPRIVKHELVWYYWQKNTNPIMSCWGVPEPPLDAPRCNHKPYLVCVPLLGMNKNGFRIGYGKGFYDKFLANCKPKVILAFAHEIPIIEFENEIHDVKCTHALDANGLKII